MDPRGSFDDPECTFFNLNTQATFISDSDMIAYLEEVSDAKGQMAEGQKDVDVNLVLLEKSV